ncbi:MAG: dynamin family protein [Sedimentisphaerales bacterium]|nr:dynamin family protein [Sedimentisphaerales bacterium]
MDASEKNDVQVLLEQTVEQLNGLESGFSREISSLNELKDRFLTGRFHLAVLGQFKRGKSTLLNALLGQAVLPTAVVPLTAIPTFIQAGQEFSAKVLFEDKKPPAEYTASDSNKLVDFLLKYVAETNNPANQLNVRQVEVYHPAEILRNGVVLIDTPGIGSTYKHNTEATLNFLPQCDAAMFLVSADPPITEVEIEFLKQVRRKIPKLFFILNKVDYLNEQEKEEILSFVKKVISEQVGVEKETDIFCVSARLGLQARENNNSGLWNNSGLDKVETYLIDFLANKKTEALRQAVRKKAADILTDVLMQVHLSVKSLQMPLEDLEKRLKIFGEKLAELERSKLSEMDILEGDKKRTHEFLEEHSEQLRQKSRTYLKGVAEETFSKLEPEQLNEDTIENSLAEAIPGFFEHEMGKSTEIFQDKMRQVLGPHRERLNKLIGSIRQTAAELFDIPYQQVQTVQDFEVEKRPYWVSHQWARSFQRIPRGMFDKLLPSGFRKSQLTKRAMEQINELVTQNVENLRWAVYQNIDKSFIRFRSELQGRFEQTLIATRGAIDAALKKRKEHSEQITGELIRLDSARITLEEIKEAFISKNQRRST